MFKCRSAACVWQDVTLKGFSGTFEILVRVRETSEVQTSTVKTCLFNPKEFISKCIQALLSQMVSVTHHAKMHLFMQCVRLMG